ncbi:carboxymuconolactone decarboxylase family protein [Streptomyces sp. AK02-01A]|uniref:carboxymuconolactone decarboxylase family protein n=1 Tax=Streptomyces sp. AK02-01A TaxID=3028648 RepID=UPI0029B6DB16|nr:carboxymuconolactone decarboxylase family protein [Streptomyces sp. AK02-01A]MDX3855226.1 carboxymuconolactone decarboxylase family protein [Streptomyces sp. AK02-01A]
MTEQNIARAAAAELKHQYESLLDTYATTPALSVMDRELATVAALAPIGSKGVSRLAAHMHAALDAGATQQTIVEGLATMSQASGTPTSVNAIAVAAKVFAERDDKQVSTEAERVWVEGDAPGGSPQERSERAQKTILEVYPAGPTDETYTAISTLAPHFWRDVIGVFYNDLFLHPGTSIKYRELFVMSTYVAVNSTPLQIIWHTNGALNTGWTRQEVAEIFTHLALDIGITNAMTALRYGKQVFDQRDERGTAKPHEPQTVNTGRGRPDARFEKGSAALAQLNPEGLPRGEGWDVAEEYAPGLHRLAVGHLYGDLLARDGLDDRAKHLALISAVTAQGGVTEQLAFHIEAALNAGVTREDIVETITLMAAVGGFVRAGDAIETAETVFTRRDAAGLSN